MMQDNEDDAIEVGTTEISDLLGDKENLYQKILYLVIADSAYSEGMWKYSFHQITPTIMFILPSPASKQIDL